MENETTDDSALRERFAAVHGIPVSHVWASDVKGGTAPAIPPKLRVQFVADVLAAGLKSADVRRSRKWARYFTNDRTAHTWIAWARGIHRPEPPVSLDSTREQLIAWLQWNDRDGCYSDDQCKTEGAQPWTREALLEQVQRELDEDGLSLADKPRT